MRKTTITLLLIVALLTRISLARVLFFGKTHHGKTTCINTACDLSLPVAKPGQYYSTTKKIDEYECLNNKVIDTIGIFDYDPTGTSKFGVQEILTLILENAEKNGLSGIAWIWGTKETVGNHDLESIFETLRVLLPNLPMAIVENQFPGCHSNVPKHLSEKYKLPLLQVNDKDASQLQSWIQKTNSNVRIKLPSDWKNYLVKHDIEGLQKELFNASFIACDTIRDQLKAITEKLKISKEPQEQCHCSQDCRRREVYSCGIFDLNTCSNEWIDKACQDSVLLCYQNCKNAHTETVGQYRQLLSDLNKQHERIFTPNADLLKTCDTFKLRGSKRSGEL